MVKHAGEYLRLALAVAILVAMAIWLYRHYKPQNALRAHLSSIVPVRADQRLDCATFLNNSSEKTAAGTQGLRPLVILALGQSNAGNHGVLSPTSAAPIAMVIGRDCLLADDPLPGATGLGGSIWRHLPTGLAKDLNGRRVVLSLLAVDATGINDWTQPSSELGLRLETQIKHLVALGMAPDFLLWQQGEADARKGVSVSDYQQGLLRLADLTHRAGSAAPVVVALSTVCRSEPNENVRRAVAQIVANHPRFVAGPDTDRLLDGAYRSDGCHLNAKGLQQAAALWAAVLGPKIKATFP